MALGAAHSLHSPNVLHVYGKKIKLRQFPQLMWFFWLFTPRLSSVVFTWLKEIPSIFCLPMLQYLAQYQNIPPRPPYYAFFAFLWLFMGRITARFTHTGDGQRLRGLVTDYQISGNYRTAFSQIVSGSFSTKGGINKKLTSIAIMIPYPEAKSSVYILLRGLFGLWFEPTNRGWIKSWLLCKKGDWKSWLLMRGAGGLTGHHCLTMFVHHPMMHLNTHCSTADTYNCMSTIPNNTVSLLILSNIFPS